MGLDDIITIPLRKGDKRVDLNVSAGMLRRQKEWLLTQDAPQAAGVVSLIDHIQDALVDEFGMDENVVFGPEYGKYG